MRHNQLQKKKVFKRTRHSGFGLVEIMVSLSIFALVITAGMGGVLTMIDANQKAQTLSSVMTNLSIALEGMARQVRVGTQYRCMSATDTGTAPRSCPNGESMIAFRPAIYTNSNDRIYYKLENNQLKMRKVENNVDVTGGFQAVTAEEVKIEDLKFYVQNAEGTNGHPKVLLVLKGYVETRSNNRSEFNLQTTMSQRAIGE